MKFGFDIDDTLINLREYAFQLYNQKLNKNLDLSVFQAIKTVGIHEPFGLLAHEGKALWNSMREEIYFTNCPPFPMAVEVLNELVNNGHEVYYITARNKQFAVQTKDWMKQLGFPISEEHFYCGMEDHEKIHVIHRLELDYYFDDKPAVLHTLLDTSINVYVKDQPYNKELNINRIKDWSELPQLLKQKGSQA
ncbi:5' nucleotidase, NT5C type [Niallia sp. 01092]|uniref:5' nucleotidase, NT5C type n=1 Tax=unclassified Niallia TaxID=2837522 RepID=UPI003FD39315